MSPPYKAEFVCTLDSCGSRYPLSEIIYTCKKDNELLEVEHDISAIQKLPPSEWKEIFSQRWKSTKGPFSSGVWAKKEWVLPGIDPENIVTQGEGATYLYPALEWGKELGLKELWIKQCGVSHTGSFKDLGMTVLVSQVKQMIRDGAKIQAVACASTGDTSAALASYAARAGIPSIIFLPSNKVSNAQLIQPVSNGSLVLSLDTDFDGCMRIVKEVTKDNSIYLANSMNSLRVEGQKTVAIEILQQLDYEVPDWIIIPGGNLGNISALYKGLKLCKDAGLVDRLPRLVLAQTAGASPIYKSYKDGYATYSPVMAQKTWASAIQIGDPVSIKKAIKALQATDGVVEIATEEELADAAAIGDRYGLYNCPHTGVALAVLKKLIGQKTIAKNEKVVVISTAHGLKFTEFKVSYHTGKISNTNPDWINPILECPADASKVLEIIQSKIGNGRKHSLSQ